MLVKLLVKRALRHPTTTITCIGLAVPIALHNDSIPQGHDVCYHGSTTMIPCHIKSLSGLRQHCRVVRNEAASYVTWVLDTHP
jgi:hypothetical protein